MKTSALAIWSLVTGILGFCCIGPFGILPAIICGHMALSRMKQSGGQLGGGGMAIAGLVLGYLGLAL